VNKRLKAYVWFFSRPLVFVLSILFLPFVMNYRVYVKKDFGEGEDSKPLFCLILNFLWYLFPLLALALIFEPHTHPNNDTLVFGLTLLSLSVLSFDVFSIGRWANGVIEERVAFYEKSEAVKGDLEVVDDA